jgi:hypothetical protein
MTAKKLHRNGYDSFNRIIADYTVSTQRRVGKGVRGCEHVVSRGRELSE